MTRLRLGEMLLDRKYVTEDQLMRAISEQSNREMRLGELLLADGAVKKDVLVGVMQEILHTAYKDCLNICPDADALACISETLARKHCVLPFRISDKVLDVLMVEPQNFVTLDELIFATGLRIQPFFGFRSEILSGIAKAYATEKNETIATPSGHKEIREVDIEFIGSGSSTSNEAAVSEFQAELRGQKTEAVLLVSEIIAAAIEKRASDIHIEQYPNETVVRIRIDGVLRELRRVNDDLRAKLVSRIKILSDLDISEKRISQDGRFLVRVGEERFDVRVSTLPTQNGEKVVMRLLDPRTACVPFERLGFSSQGSKKFQQLIRQPQGMVLVTGPTGSGKSTTLYSAVNSIRSSSINITTIEDPIEYVIEGLNQVQVNKRSGRTFASCLRSILRQDPNVVLVGEIRDAETAEIALTSAQTGHLLLSTLHTNDSLSAVSRLADLGIPAFLIASSLSAVLAQRLVRKLCENCSSPEPLDKDQASLLQSLDLRHMPKLLFAAKGCEKCDGEGYRGRVGIYELLVVDEVLAEAIRSGAQEEVLRDLAIASGMVPLMDDALAKVIKGMTTLEEVVRVVPQSKRKNVACGNCDQLLSPAFRFCPQCATPIGSCVRRNVDLLSPLAGVLNSFDPSTRPI